MTTEKPKKVMPKGGRPKGTKNRSGIRRDILWAYRNLERLEVKPPSEGALWWREYAKKHPDKFLGWVYKMDQQIETDDAVRDEKNEAVMELVDKLLEEWGHRKSYVP